ncbi:MAG: type III-B CRISPR module RAMP protein Cmr1 [Bacteroidetes bacterium]|nr:type III-B CRISPR module RAMP protein Cmr1 [Bacteroidota bacterium]MCW5897542.1 type III-B CRISPR module RAMP protein Cmr1 [Bacteroidota bacterium]
MRHKPSIKPPENWDPPITAKPWTLQLKVITPLFGGGYKAREVDPICVIRPAAIRGHLRFWWRATAGAGYSSPKDLFEAEEKIWGSAEKPGQVALQIRLSEPGKPIKCAEYKWNTVKNRYPAIPKFVEGWPPYALQPFQGKATKTAVVEQPAFARVDVEFELSISVDSTALHQIESAIAAWIAYGGIGARSRRGCGTLGFSKSDGPKVTSLISRSPNAIVALDKSQYVAGVETSDPIAAWRMAVETYWAFRQKPGFAREPASGSPPTPGRSRWPEPDSIRRMYGNASTGHEPSHLVNRGFPRADLGLPIIFHFKDYDDRKKPSEKNDPPDTTLEGPRDGLSRMASPVITKAMPTSQGRYRPILLVLNTIHVWHLGNLRLSGSAKGAVTTNDIDLSGDDRAKVYPLHEFSDRPIREALLDFTAKQWKSKVEVI